MKIGAMAWKVIVGLGMAIVFSVCVVLAEEPEKAKGALSSAETRKSRTFPANNYGLYAMAGGVWEWTSDYYDAQSYTEIVDRNAVQQRVIRGGSWADDAEALRLSFRASSRDTVAATIGFRLGRVRKG